MLRGNARVGIWIQMTDIPVGHECPVHLDKSLDKPLRTPSLLEANEHFWSSAMINFKVASLIRRILIIERHLGSRRLGWVLEQLPSTGWHAVDWVLRRVVNIEASWLQQKNKQKTQNSSVSCFAILRSPDNTFRLISSHPRGLGGNVKMRFYLVKTTVVWPGERIRIMQS